MCYTIDGLLKKQIRHAQRKGAPTDVINTLIDQYNNLIESGDAITRVHHNVSGFVHPLLAVAAATIPYRWKARPYRA